MRLGSSPRIDASKYLIDPSALQPAPLAQAVNFTMQTTPFRFRVARRTGGDVLFESGPLVLSEQYVHLSTAAAPNGAFYGLGERVDALRLPLDRNFTLWNNHPKPNWEGVNLYGSQPLLLEVRPDGQAHGLLFLTPHGMDVELAAAGRVTWRTMGDSAEVFLLPGPAPRDVLAQYARLVGRPYFIPKWTLGYHQCRWGYHDVAACQQVVDAHRASNIPLDTMWNDIDYMDHYKDFTANPGYAPAAMRNFVETLHAHHQQYVMIMEPHIHVNASYEPYASGHAQGVFMLEEDRSAPIVGNILPGNVSFVDFSNPAAAPWWTSHIRDFHGSWAPFDGLWLDQNEPTSNWHGCKGAPPQNRWDVPPYVPHTQGTINRQLPSLAAWMHVGRHYDAHQMYPYFEFNASRAAMEQIRQKRAFVIGRSTFTGVGRHGAHWLGDNRSSFRDLRQSIAGMLAFAMFNVPMVGADIGGFYDTCNAELFARWIQLGSFYPFARNHNRKNLPGQEITAFPAHVVDIARAQLERRYRLLPYWYTLFADAHRTASPVIAPLFFEWPRDAATRDIDTALLVGRALMIAPVLEAGATQRDVYFPPGERWYAFDSGIEQRALGTQQVSAPLTVIPVYARGGHVIPARSTARLTVHETEQQDVELIVALSANGTASGRIYLDDGDSLRTVAAGKYLEASVNMAAMTLHIKPLHASPTLLIDLGAQSHKVSTLRIFGLTAFTNATKSLRVETAKRTVEHTKFSMDWGTHVLTVKGLDLNLAAPATVHFATPAGSMIWLVPVILLVGAGVVGLGLLIVCIVARQHRGYTKMGPE